MVNSIVIIVYETPQPGNGNYSVAIIEQVKDTKLDANINTIILSVTMHYIKSNELARHVRNRSNFLLQV